MSLYRVLVAHNGYRVNEFIETDTPVLRYVKKVPDAPRDAEPVDLAGPADPVPALRPRKSKSADKAVLEVGHVEDRAVSDDGLPDSES